MRPRPVDLELTYLGQTEVSEAEALVLDKIMKASESEPTKAEQDKASELCQGSTGMQHIARTEFWYAP